MTRVGILVVVVLTIAALVRTSGADRAVVGVVNRVDKVVEVLR